MSEDVSGFHKIRAKDLSPSKQEELRKVLQRELTEALIRSIKVDPPGLDMDSIKLILKQHTEHAIVTPALINLAMIRRPTVMLRGSAYVPPAKTKQSLN